MINESASPWIRIQGDLNLLAHSILLNLSFTKKLKSEKVKSPVNFLIEVNALTRIIFAGYRIEAISQAGPLPIDLPKTIILLSKIPSLLTR